MNVVDLCPACLTELPEDYPFDHVAIDQALGKRPELFARMANDERLEVVLTGLARGISINQLGLRFRWGNTAIRELLPAGHPESYEMRLGTQDAERASKEARVREMWAKGCTDAQIGAAFGRSQFWAFEARRSYGLPAQYKRGRRVAVPA